VRLIVALLSVALLGAACGGSGDAPSGASGELATITSVEQFARAFDEGSGHPRLVLLLSPT
jgi:hypothetical protein